MVGPSVAELRVLRLRRTWEIFMIKQVIPGSRWLYGERIVEIDGPLSSHQVRVLDLGSGRLLAISMHELQPIPIAVKESKLLEVSQEEWERARLLAQAFAPYANSTYLPGKITKAIAEQIGLSLRQILRLRTDYQSSQQTTSLVRRPGGRPLGLRLLNPQVEQLIQHVVTKYLARREPDTKASICERVRLMCKRLNLSPPDPKTVLSRIRAEEGFWLECQRQGTKAARQRFEARPGKLTVEGALALIQIDHTRVDLIVVDDDDPSLVIGRPWLTLAIDVATRTVVGYYLSMDPPSAISVAMCMAHVMQPKSENDLAPGLWPMYGKPACILVDNGKDLRSIALQRGCEQHGITLTWRPVLEPHYGAHIERLMGTFMRRVHTLPGTTFSNVKNRGDYPSERRACFTLSDFRIWLVEQICHGYHVRHHRGIGMPPLVAWERMFQLEDGSSALPPAPVDRMALRRDFFPFVYRRMRRTGVQYAQSRYWHESLAPLIHPERQVMVHYDPGDPSRVWIRGDDNILIEAAAVAGAAFGEGQRIKLNSADQERMDKLKLLGYDRADAIQDNAEQRKLACRQKSESSAPTVQRGKQAKRGMVPNTSNESSNRPPVQLNRASIRVEVLDS